MDWALLFLILVAVIFFVLGIVCVVIVILGLPGTWIMLALAVVIEISDGLYLSSDQQPTFPLWLLISCGVLALTQHGIFDICFSPFPAEQSGGVGGSGLIRMKQEMLPQQRGSHGPGRDDKTLHDKTAESHRQHKRYDERLDRSDDRSFMGVCGRMSRRRHGNLHQDEVGINKCRILNDRRMRKRS